MAGKALEERVRRVVGRRLRRGQQTECAAAAGHKAPWLSKWLSGGLSATVDELAALTSYVGVALSTVIATSDASPLDWEVFGLMGRLSDDRKRVARDLVERIADESILIVAPEPRPTARGRRRSATRKRPPP